MELTEPVPCWVATLSILHAMINCHFLPSPNFVSSFLQSIQNLQNREKPRCKFFIVFFPLFPKKRPSSLLIWSELSIIYIILLNAENEKSFFILVPRLLFTKDTSLALCLGLRGTFFSELSYLPGSHPRISSDVLYFLQDVILHYVFVMKADPCNKSLEAI